MATRRRTARFPDPAERVSAAVASAYLTALRGQGIGYRRAAQLAGLNDGLVAGIRNGRVRVIRADTQARILNIRPSLAHGAHVMGWRTWRLLNSLLGEGYQKQEIARKLGLRSPRLQLQHPKVTVKNALKVRTLYARLNAEMPDALRTDAQCSRRPRRLACRLWASRA